MPILHGLLYLSWMFQCNLFAVVILHTLAPLRTVAVHYLATLDDLAELLVGISVFLMNVLILDKGNDVFKGGVDAWFSILVWTYSAILICTNCFYQYSLSMVLPTFIFYSQSRFHVSNLVDLTLVMDGPNARWAPAQFMQMNTPKSKDAPS